MEQQYKTDAEIYAVLEREIIDLTIRPGSSLSENPLCARFGAPRSLIRVVLQKLQENGLVRIVPYKGTTVTRLNRRIVDELIYERTAVEGRILRDFAPNATPAQRAQIRARVDAYEALARALAAAKAKGRNTVHVKVWLPLPAACPAQSNITLDSFTAQPP